MIILCSWCVKPTHYSNTTDFTWKKITGTLVDLLEKNPGPISHGICAPCAEEVRNEIHREENQKEAGYADAEPDQREDHRSDDRPLSTRDSGPREVHHDEAG